MSTTPNMGLTTWEDPGDHFSRVELEDNLEKIDAHQHTGAPDDGQQIPTGGIANLAITTGKLANVSVTTAKLADNAVTTAKIGDDQVTNAKIADNAVDNAQIADNAVGNAELADNAVNTAEIANDAVTEPKIADNAVTDAQIADGAVGADAINSSQVAVPLGLGQTGTVRRGKTIVTTEETFTGVGTAEANYGLMTTPDRVFSVNVATDGLLFVRYSAAWKAYTIADSNKTDGRAAIFLGNTMLRQEINAGEPQFATYYSPDETAGSDALYAPLTSFPGGLVSQHTIMTDNYGGPFDGIEDGQEWGEQVATGWPGGFVPWSYPATGTDPGTVAGLAVITVLAGQYDVSIRFAAASGAAIKRKNARLHVWTIGF